MGTEEKNKGWCKVIMKMLFSHVGLCVLVGLYCVAGGFIFKHLEMANERQICYDTLEEYDTMENDSLSKVQDLVIKYEGLADKSTLSIQLKGILQIYRDNSINIGYEGEDCTIYGEPDGPKYKWSWSGAFFFSVTVISTIGYGHIAPKTFWGRLVCIAYAVLGIPLMLLCLANIGDALAEVFRFIYAKIFCCGCCRKKEKNKVIHIRPASQTEPASWSDKSKILDQKMADDSNDTKTPVKIVPMDVQSVNKNTLTQRKHSKNIVECEESDDDDDDDFGEDVTIPLTVTMIVIAGYIIGGAILFGLWEGWDLLQSSYFCFITLSTIGFGDVVPGTDFDNPLAHAQMVLGAIYVLFGMAILSMCFTLMQDEIISKCKWLGEKLGILDKEEE